MLMYQVDQLPSPITEAFLALLGSPRQQRPEGVGLDEAVRTAVLGLRERTRAVTIEDYEWLALHDWPKSDPAAPFGQAARLARARCVPRRNLSAADPAVRAAPAPGHLSLVVLPERPPGGGEVPQPSQELCGALWTWFDALRMLTTQHHVVGPVYVPVQVAADLALHGDAPPEAALAAAQAALEGFFDPLLGGPDGSGWPFGWAVHASEVYAVLDGVDLVDYVEAVGLSTTATGDRLRAGSDGSVEHIELDDHELASLEGTALVTFDVAGRHYP
jgi:hypothetical protein